MDEKETSDCLNRDVHHILEGHSLSAQDEPGEYGELLNIAYRLAHNDMSHQSHVRSVLKQKLIGRLRDQDQREVWSPNPFKGNRTMQPKLRAIPFALAALTVLVIAIAVTPAGQVFAQNIWQKVGPLIIVNKVPPNQAPSAFDATATPLPGSGTVPQPLPALTGPTPRPGEGSGNEQAADPLASPTPMPASNIFEPLSDQMVWEKYGFQVLQPAYLPADYQNISEHQVSRTENGRIVSRTVYDTASTAFDAPYLSIQQSTTQEETPVEFMVGDAQVSQVSVRGYTATYVEDANLMTVQDAAGNDVTIPVDYLMWEENGSFFLMDATQLSQEEMIRVAESLQ